jgi:hypothetical protein
MDNENLSRLEQYLRAISEGTGAEGLPVPQSRMEEICLAIIMGDESLCPVPQSRLEAYACACVGAGGGGETPTQEKTITITESGTVEVIPDEGYALGKVTAMAQVYDAVDDRVKQIIEGTIETISDDAVTKVANYAFYDMHVTNVNLPAVTEIGKSGFGNTKRIENIYIPNLVKVGSNAFDASQISRAYFPLLKNTSTSSTGTANVFQDCTNLEIVELPQIKAIGYAWFSYCTHLKSVYIPNINIIASFAFSRCSSLEHLDLWNATHIYGNAFSNSTNLKTIILRGSELTTLSASPFANTGAFKATQFDNTYTNSNGGIVLCPQSLTAEYPNATNWSVMYAGGKCLFWALEDYTVDGTIEGEIDWDKLNTDRETAFPEGGTTE